MGIRETNDIMEDLISYWQFHKQFDANITDLAQYTRVSRNTG